MRSCRCHDKQRTPGYDIKSATGTFQSNRFGSNLAKDSGDWWPEIWRQEYADVLWTFARFKYVRNATFDQHAVAGYKGHHLAHFTGMATARMVHGGPMAARHRRIGLMRGDIHRLHHCITHHATDREYCDQKYQDECTHPTMIRAPQKTS